MTRHERHDGPVRLLVGALALALALPAAAQVPTAKPIPSPRPAGAGNAAPSIDPVFDAARAAYEARPLADRVALQDGLVWTGDYSGALDGTFGRMTFQAITAFQTRHRFTPDGIPTAPALKLLAETATAKKAAVGFQSVDDKATGVRIHLPTKLLGPPLKREAGSRWVGREGRIQIDTYAFADTDLAGFFERMKAEAPGRKVVYAVLRSDWFVISDEAGGRHGYTRFVRGADGIRGFLFSVDASLGAELDRVVIATAGRFEPFPGTTPAAGPTAATTGPTPPSAPTAPSTPSTPAASTVPAASGLVVAEGKVLTAAAAVAGCGALTVAGRPATIAVADAQGVATLTVAGVAASGTIRTAAALGGSLTVVASGESAGRATRVAVPGEAVDGRLRAALQRGAQGAPVVDATGALVALVAARPDERRAIAGLVPPAAYDLVAPPALAAAVTAAGGTRDGNPGEPTTTGRSVAGWSARVVAVDCRR
jgi:peptidoglycan hydrolase-like protein with peptidoglycan-binding domain